MSVFDFYSKYYELLYRDKDYDGEAAFIDALIKKHGQAAGSILELGCGTGKHAHCLAKRDYRVCGVDFSEGMAAQANHRRDSLEAGLKEKLEFSVGDIRKVRLEKKFDVAISLFHVISYQTTNQDILDALTTARTHLESGGIFIFDIWYGPAVLTTPPDTRIKRLEDEEISVTRLAEPELYANDNHVDVNYHVFVRNKKDDSVQEVRETHKMRYLFKPEIELFFANSGFEPLETGEFLTGKPASRDTWGVYFVARAK